MNLLHGLLRVVYLYIETPEGVMGHTIACIVIRSRDCSTTPADGSYARTAEFRHILHPISRDLEHGHGA